MFKVIVNKVKKFFQSIILIINPMMEVGPEADKLLQEFINSESGKAALAGLKKTDKESLEKILILLTDKVKGLTKNNTQVTRLVLEYFKKKILSLAQ